jgi:UDP-N-acetylmuramoylalanine--D-glutamate ligase
LDGVTTIAEANGLAEAVRVATESAMPGDVVLLSPACASFDLFQNFEDRGNQFKAMVKGLS